MQNAQQQPGRLVRELLDRDTIPTTRPQLQGSTIRHRERQPGCSNPLFGHGAGYTTHPRTKLSHVSFIIYSEYYSYVSVAISSFLNDC